MGALIRKKVYKMSVSMYPCVTVTKGVSFFFLDFSVLQARELIEYIVTDWGDSLLVSKGVTDVRTKLY